MIGFRAKKRLLAGSPSMTNFAIQVDLKHPLGFPFYVRIRPDWDGSWVTRFPRDARRYKTRQGADRARLAYGQDTVDYLKMKVVDLP